jgi:hypothetical protein
MVAPAATPVWLAYLAMLHTQPIVAGRKPWQRAARTVRLGKQKAEAAFKKKKVQFF